ncbi:hypothetical protein PHLGIDRAFT_186284 [Phlebiopsis gigantea 11061_1 CR5-6]|uniref:Hydrophobin n=1 Tax=Phlebiopsis gigantea (strain 11061_1 CR5-6) TaxID=745531 RepID=A0A0C3SCH4_PHLG1|nr:hypothetical protein PHLGIDRAFT_186284 [Phlebiopsis gigantea 11061_1 CR5-6]
MARLHTFSATCVALTLTIIAVATPTPTLDTRQLPIGCPLGATLQCCSLVTPTSLPIVGGIGIGCSEINVIPIGATCTENVVCCNFIELVCWKRSTFLHSSLTSCRSRLTLPRSTARQHSKSRFPLSLS